MSRWKGIARGIAGLGAIFGAISGSLAAVLAAGLAVFAPGVEGELGFMIMAFTVWGTLIGAGFATVLAIAGKGRSFDELTLPRTGMWGAGGGLLIAVALVGSTLSQWTLGDATVPFVMLPLLGAGSATAALVLARKASPALGQGEESLSLGEGEADALPDGS